MENVISGGVSTTKLLAPMHAERPIAPVDVWDWQAYDTWRSVIWELLSDIVSDDVRRMFRASPPKYLVSDDLSWLDQIIHSSHGLWVDSKEYLAERLRDYFRAFRAVHGTRAVNLDDYYLNGLVPHSPNKIQAKAREIFLSGEFQK